MTADTNELRLHDEIVQLRKDRDAHLMDESDYTTAILSLIRRCEATAVVAALEELKDSDSRTHVFDGYQLRELDVVEVSDIDAMITKAKEGLK